MKLPSNAKKVFNGIIFDVYQWEQEAFDGSKHTYEMLKRADTAVVIPITTDGKILVTDEEQPGKPPFVSVPGGKVDEGENPEEGAKRELLEETGYTSDNVRLWNKILPASKIDWTIYTYVAKDCRKITEPNLEAGEKITVRELNFEEFLEFVLQDNFSDTQIQMEVLKAKVDPQKMEQLKRDFFD